MLAKKIFIIAGEASGDLLGAKLIKAIKHNAGNDIEFYGIGGKRMEEEGIKSLFPISEISVMGFLEIIPHIPNIFARINQTVEKIKQIEPDILITIDSPGFNFRIAKKIRQSGLITKLVHYVAPSVWAYKPERAKKIAEIYDQLLTLLPFEPQYFLKEGLDTKFVGHPIMEHTEFNKIDIRKKYKIEKDEKILCVMPGSRVSEIKRILPEFCMTLNRLKGLVNEDFRVIIPTFPYLKPIIVKILNRYNISAIIVETEDEKYSVFSEAYLALVKSGTNSLELAKFKVPMVVGYKVNPITAYLMKRMILIKYVSIVNIINNEMTIPEFIQENCNPNLIIQELFKLYTNHRARDKQLEGMNTALAKLLIPSKEDPSQIAAMVIKV